METILSMSVGLAGLISVILALVRVGGGTVGDSSGAEDRRISRESQLASFVTVPFFMYLAILTVGNSVSTVLASVMLGEAWGESLGMWYSLIYAFIGVFGFEAVISKMNVTVAEQKALTIYTWLREAEARTIGAVLEKQRELDERFKTDLIELLRLLEEEELDTFCTTYVGAEDLRKINNEVLSGRIDLRYVKAFVLVEHVPRRMARILKGRNRK